MIGPVGAMSVYLGVFAAFGCVHRVWYTEGRWVFERISYIRHLPLTTRPDDE